MLDISRSKNQQIKVLKIIKNHNFRLTKCFQVKLIKNLYSITICSMYKDRNKDLLYNITVKEV